MAEKPDKKIESKYPVVELLVNAEALFSVRGEVVIGALHGHNEVEFTVSEVKRLVDQFLKRKVN
ncbi:hypothetical protein [Paenibacillus lutimineralis]|uniref:YqzN/YkzM domain-containing protein n=1 Tax=Paenibacillus lutimineralis TaxID=2707005 RepID=A0A3Q9I920_9BACL|nr:hypothetical protein [Paenibacillus lutimineralis]AZS15364.1 hypothetical protein EI981_13415 [Paenibacillus lutimineralis]